ncbi:MAG: helix-turn-helix domain-containing protein [Pseudomonadales bacterium]|nr:helix-turn-helix domain-containing protein [Pseudomonadales bacterium]
MARKISSLPPRSADLLHRLGERLRLLRVRHRLSAKQMAAAAGMSVMTLRSLERGGDGVTMGAYLAVMAVLGIERDLDGLAAAAFGSGGDEPPRVIRGTRPQVPGDGLPAVSARGPAAAGPAAADDPPPLVAPDEDGAVPELAVVSAPQRDANSDPGFEWLDAPARDLRRLVQFDAGGPAADDRGQGDDQGATPDLFAGLSERDAS